MQEHVACRSFLASHEMSCQPSDLLDPEILWLDSALVAHVAGQPPRVAGRAFTQGGLRWPYRACEDAAIQRGKRGCTGQGAGAFSYATTVVRCLVEVMTYSIRKRDALLCKSTIIMPYHCRRAGRHSTLAR